MGYTGEKKSTAVSTTWYRRGAIALAIGAAFWLGWLVATQKATSPPHASPANTNASAASPTSQVALQLDAGSLSLVPDAGLHLDPLPELDPDALYRESLDAGAGASAPDGGPDAPSPIP